MNPSRKALFFQLFSAFIFLASTAFNAISQILPLNGKDMRQLSEADYNYFLPAPLTFSIWSVIYVLLLFNVIYVTRQLYRRDTDVMYYADAVTPYFIFLNILNACWLAAYHYTEMLLSLFVILLMLVLLVVMYRNIVSYEERFYPNPVRRFLLAIPFSIYMGWISVAVIANFASVFVHYGWTHLFLSPFGWGIAVVSLAGLIGSYMLYRYHDIVFTLAIAWGLYGLSVRTADHGLENFDSFNRYAFICAMVLAGFTVLSLIRDWRVRIASY